MAIKLSELAKQTGCRLHGDDCLIENVADINHAAEGQLAFIYNPRYLDAINTTAASAIILKEEWLEQCDKPALIADNPRLAFVKATQLLNPERVKKSGIAKDAVIADDVVVPEDWSYPP